MRTAGVAIILVTLTALWAYNTGRLETILSVIKDPSYKPGKTEYVAGLGSIGIPGLGGTPSGGIGDIFGSGLPSTPPITGTGSGDWLSTIGGIFGGLGGSSSNATTWAGSDTGIGGLA